MSPLEKYLGDNRGKSMALSRSRVMSWDHVCANENLRIISLIASGTNGKQCAISCFKMNLAAEGYHWVAIEGIEHSKMGIQLVGSLPRASSSDKTY